MFKSACSTSAPPRIEWRSATANLLQLQKAAVTGQIPRHGYRPTLQKGWAPEKANDKIGAAWLQHAGLEGGICQMRQREFIGGGEKRAVR
jgi:hypothetical protein